MRSLNLQTRRRCKFVCKLTSAGDVKLARQRRASGRCKFILGASGVVGGPRATPRHCPKTGNAPRPADPRNRHAGAHHFRNVSFGTMGSVLYRPDLLGGSQAGWTLRRPSRDDSPAFSACATDQWIRWIFPRLEIGGRSAHHSP